MNDVGETGLGVKRAPGASSAVPAHDRHLLGLGDCLDICRDLPPQVSFDLVYLDPPYNVGGDFTARLSKGQSRGRRIDASDPFAFADRWGGLDAFATMLMPRVSAMRDRMAPGATMYIHLDHRTVHEVKVECDRLFGRGAFLGEVIWLPGNGARARRGPSTTHHTLLVYARSQVDSRSIVWNADDPALREPFAATSTKTHFRNVDESGRRYRLRTVAGKSYRYFLDEGRRMGSVWSDCPAMQANTPLLREGTGYPTQKPEKLLERIVRASSLPGATVADLMCGSGTTLVAAARAGRRFVGGDIGELAIRLTSERLGQLGISFDALGRHAPGPSGSSGRDAR